MRVDPSPAMVKGTRQFEYIGTTLHFLYSLHSKKFEQLTSSIMRSCSSRDFIVVALCCRSLFETTAAISALNESILNVGKHAKSKDTFAEDEIKRLIDIVNQHSRGGRFDWELFFTADIDEFMRRSFGKGEIRIDKTRAMPESTNILTFLNRLYEKDKYARIAYAYLSELAHPNVGSSFLVMGDEHSHVAAGRGCDSVGGFKIACIALSILRPSVLLASAELDRLLQQARKSGCKAGTVSHGFSTQ